MRCQKGSSGSGSSSNANQSGGSSTNHSVRAEAHVLVLPENTNEVVVVVPDDVLESGDKGKSEESVHFEQGEGSVLSLREMEEMQWREEEVEGSCFFSLIKLYGLGSINNRGI